MYRPDASHITIIGGGSGTATLYPEIVESAPEATAIVSMSDSGGSSGDISNQLGVPPVGDLRNVMLAASLNEAVREMQMHRFGGVGHLHGHAWGNLTLAACIERHGLQHGVEKAAQIFQVPGKVLPVTLDQHQLVMQDGSNAIYGEHAIDTHRPNAAEPTIRLQPPAPINPDAEHAIYNADLIVIAPGSIYTSLLAALTVDGVTQALAATKAPKVLVANLVTEAHQTDGWHVVDYIHTLRRHNTPLDYVLYNTKMPTASMRESYLLEGQQPVDSTPRRFGEIKDVRAIGAPLLSEAALLHDPDNPIKRNVIRHEPSAVYRQLTPLLVGSFHTALG